MNEIDVTEYALCDWMEDLDRLVLARSGLSIHDLPDMPYRVAFDRGEDVYDFFEDEVADRLAEFGWTAEDA